MVEVHISSRADFKSVEHQTERVKERNSKLVILDKCVVSKLLQFFFIIYIHVLVVINFQYQMSGLSEWHLGHCTVHTQNPLILQTFILNMFISFFLISDTEMHLHSC